MTVKIVIMIFTCTTMKYINARNNMSGFIVGGDFSTIEKFPFSVYISKSCGLNKKNSSCGASILNQALLLTAGHCFFNCDPFRANAYSGSVRKYEGLESKIIGYRVHENYNDTSKANDIGLVVIEKPLTLGLTINKVILMKLPPQDKLAVIAGWGHIDSIGTRGSLLKHADQQVISQERCSQIVGRLPKGSICGVDPNNEPNYPERGDSGSALVINESIQIGIVSLKRRSFTNQTVIYTNISYFYDWIRDNAKALYCAHVHNMTHENLEHNNIVLSSNTNKHGPIYTCDLGKHKPVLDN